MSERPPKSSDPDIEHIPTPEEVLEVMTRMFPEGYEETQRHLDAEGNLFQLDAVAPGTQKDESIEIYYVRKGSHSNGTQSAATEVYCMSVMPGYNGPGGPQASLIDGKWVVQE